jgi:hypothetical protein
MEFEQDETKMRKFEQGLHELLEFLKKQEDHSYYKSAVTLLTDNINMFNRIKELENGKANTREAAE